MLSWRFVVIIRQMSHTMGTWRGGVEVRLLNQSSACWFTVSGCFSCRSASSHNPRQTHAELNTHMIPVYTAGSHLNPRLLYCHFDVVCFLTSTSHTHPIFLANTRTLTQSRSLSSKPFTTAPPFPREGVRKKERGWVFFQGKYISSCIGQSIFCYFLCVQVWMTVHVLFVNLLVIKMIFFFSGNILSVMSLKLVWAGYFLSWPIQLDVNCSILLLLTWQTFSLQRSVWNDLLQCTLNQTGIL